MSGQEFGRYPEYKESDYEWLGAIPSHWGLKPLKHLCSFAGGSTPAKVNRRYWDGGTVHWVSPKDMKVLVLSETQDKITEVAVEETPVSLVAPGALLMVVRSGILQRTIPVAVNSVTVTLNQDMKALFFPASEGASYFAYLIQGHVSALLQRWTKEGATVESVEHEFLANDSMPDVPADEGRAIVAFLDYETTKIDALIEKQQQLIALLKEKRQAVISHAVTKGLNPDAPMRDSGVEWLGEVPAHWGVPRVKHVCTLESGHTPSRTEPSYWVDSECTVSWVSLNDTKTLDADDYIEETKVKISEKGILNSSARLIPSGSVVFNRDGARVGLASITCGEMCVSQHMIAWICGRDVLNEYLLHVIYAMRSEIYRVAWGSTIPTIGMADVRQMICPLPPRSEQRAIANRLFRVRKRLQQAEACADKSIEVLQERRVALISAAVTGKIDVRGWKAPEIEPELEIA